jgi:trans-aconitate 2-methyltransferase
VTVDSWDPEKYNQFSAEREQPFWDLTRMIELDESPTVVDLGCGDGRLTAALSDALDADSILGVDSSPAMIAAAEDHATEQIQFELGDIGSWSGSVSVDVVLANASLQWVPDHAGVLARWTKSLRPGGQLAVQIPSNADHPANLIACELASEILDHAPPDAVAENVLLPEIYSEILDSLRFDRQHVRLQVYGHQLASTADVVEWLKGSTLTRFKEPLGPTGWNQFVEVFRERLLAEIGEQTPYFYPFKRILMWARFD